MSRTGMYTYGGLALAATGLVLCLTGYTSVGQIVTIGGYLLQTAAPTTHADRSMRARWTRLRDALVARGPVTVSLVAANVAVAVVMAASALRAGVDPVQPESAPLFRAWAEIPRQAADGQWYRLVTSGFVHVGPVHLVMNMASLLVIGGLVEQRLGWIRYTVVYLVSLLGGAVAVQLLSPVGQMTVGASGAIFGVLGALVVLVWREGLGGFGRIPLLLVLALNLGLDPLFHASMQGHVGGLLVGAALTLLLLPWSRRTTDQPTAVDEHADVAVDLVASVPAA